VQASALDLAAASAQVVVARDAVSVAEQALEQAEDRFKAGRRQQPRGGAGAAGAHAPA
jgi:outer membrane protein TolC